MKVAVTGASGFIGSALMTALHARGMPARAIWRRDIGSGLTFAGVDLVIHAAGLAHAGGRGAPSGDDYQAVNVDLAEKLAGIAIRDGATRFIHISTVHVVAGNHGALSPHSPVAPISPYSASKARAEAVLKKMADQNPGFELVIARPAIVYGPGVRGSFAALKRIALSRLPLPFASISARRSMVGISNLCDALCFLAQAPSEKVAGRIFHLTDGVDLSLPEIVAAIRGAVGRSPGLLPVPPALLKAGLSIVGRSRLAEQLLEGHVVDGRDLVDAGWHAPFPPSYDLERMARAG